MANVNPPPALRIPDSLARDPDARSFLEQQQRILFQLWQRTGGPSDAIEEGEQTLTSTGSRVSRNAARINSLEVKEFDIITVTDNFTTELNQILICKNTDPITVTLDPQAVENDELHIKRRGGEVTVIGLIDGDDDLIINVLNYSLHLVFDGDDWSSV